MVGIKLDNLNQVKVSNTWSWNIETDRLEFAVNEGNCAVIKSGETNKLSQCSDKKKNSVMKKPICQFGDTDSIKSFSINTTTFSRFAVCI